MTAHWDLVSGQPLYLQASHLHIELSKCRKRIMHVLHVWRFFGIVPLNNTAQQLFT